MNPDKDYYAVLGVSPDAEEVVIRAAYRALAQRYHPDRMAGSRIKAHARMSELNEAYGVLSDSEKRKAYDQLRNDRMDADGSRFDDLEEEAPLGDDPLEKDWRIAIKYYPDLASLEARLAHFSWKLANTYRAYLLETRQFEPRESLAGLMENHFLSAHFGSNEKNLEFARKLIMARQRKAALALNETIRVLGANADPKRVIARIARDFDVKHLAVNQEKILSLLSGARAATADTAVFAEILSELGGTIWGSGACQAPDKATESKAWKIEFDDSQYEFQTEYAFRSWFRRDVLPIAERLAR